MDCRLTLSVRNALGGYYNRYRSYSVDCSVTEFLVRDSQDADGAVEIVGLRVDPDTFASEDDSQVIAWAFDLGDGDELFPRPHDTEDALCVDEEFSATDISLITVMPLQDRFLDRDDSVRIRRCGTVLSDRSLSIKLTGIPTDGYRDIHENGVLSKTARHSWYGTRLAVANTFPVECVGMTLYEAMGVIPYAFAKPTPYVHYARGIFTRNVKSLHEWPLEKDVVAKTRRMRTGKRVLVLDEHTRDDRPEVVPSHGRLDEELTRMDPCVVMSIRDDLKAYTLLDKREIRCRYFGRPASASGKTMGGDSHHVVVARSKSGWHFTFALFCIVELDTVQDVDGRYLKSRLLVSSFVSHEEASRNPKKPVFPAIGRAAMKEIHDTPGMAQAMSIATMELRGLLSTGRIKLGVLTRNDVHRMGILKTKRAAMALTNRVQGLASSAGEILTATYAGCNTSSPWHLFSEKSEALRQDEICNRVQNTGRRSRRIRV